MTPRIVTQSYRAPELAFELPDEFKSYPIDMWAAGCVFLEMICQHSVFYSQNDLELQLSILKMIGQPDRSLNEYHNSLAYQNAFKHFKNSKVMSTSVKYAIHGIDYT